MTVTSARSSPLTRRWRSAEHAQRKTLIVDVAFDLLQRRGIEHVTMRRVAHRLGVGAMTLYTYVNGQDELRRELTRRGFAMIHETCRANSTVETDGSWLGGARAYIRFAQGNPNLYNLMFSFPLTADMADREIFDAGFQPLVDRVKQRLRELGHDDLDLDDLADRRAAVFWIGMHGLATLAIAGRLDCPECSMDDLLQELVDRIKPC